VHPGTILSKWPTWCTITLYNTFIIIIIYIFRATLCSSSGGQIVLIQHLISDCPVCRLGISFSTCTLKFLLNLHTPVPSQPAHSSSFSTCTPQFLLNLHTPVPSQPAHTSSFSTCTHQFLLNLHTLVPSQPAHPSSFSTCTHQFLLNLHTPVPSQPANPSSFSTCTH